MFSSTVDNGFEMQISSQLKKKKNNTKKTTLEIKSGVNQVLGNFHCCYGKEERRFCIFCNKERQRIEKHTLPSLLLSISLCLPCILKAVRIYFWPRVPTRLSEKGAARA